MIAFSNNATNGSPIMTSKASIAADLRALGVDLSASKLKKTTLAELKAMLDAERAEEQRTKAKPAVIDLDAGSPDADEKRAMRRRSKGVNLPAKAASQLRACRAGSKQAILIDHLGKGATLAELVTALAPWTESSVKSALYWDVAKVKGYGVRTETSDDGAQRYHLVLPKGVEAPLGHVEPVTRRGWLRRRSATAGPGWWRRRGPGLLPRFQGEPGFPM
jgi:hypothetical protein